MFIIRFKAIIYIYEAKQGQWNPMCRTPYALVDAYPFLAGFEKRPTQKATSKQKAIIARCNAEPNAQHLCLPNARCGNVVLAKKLPRPKRVRTTKLPGKLQQLIWTVERLHGTERAQKRNMYENNGTLS
jgi:hypothetical protein